MKLRVVEHRRAYEVDLVGPVLLGRQDRHEAERHWPSAALPQGDGSLRLVIAWNPETDLSREYVRLEPKGGRVEVTNESIRFDVPVRGGPRLGPGQSATLAPPFHLELPRRTVSVEADGDPACDPVCALFTLPAAAPAPGMPLSHAAGLRPPAELAEPPSDPLIDWLRRTLGVLQAAVGSSEFLPRAAEALVEIVGLRSGWVLLRQGDAAWRPSDTVLAAVLRDRRTVWRAACLPDEPTVVSLAGTASLFDKEVVAAPLQSADGEVVGVLYGELPGAAGRGGGAISTPLTATLVELIACGVSAGLARQRQERQAALLGQFFPRELARQLGEHPEWLDGKTTSVTVLFCDIRGYSTIGGRLGPEKTQAWLYQVLGALSECVLAEDGVLVDYVGDELMAMWGAPKEQDDQTARAVRAGLAMHRALAGVNARWRDDLGDGADVGVGINRGEARVGNIGSEYKFKYGALGNTVNVASRTQGMTKYLKCRLLVTEGAVGHLGPGFVARRVALARLVNIKDAVNLYEVAPAGDGRGEFFRGSEQALDALERREFASAAQQAGALLAGHPGDGPLRLVLARAAEGIHRDGDGFESPWTPPGKG